MDNIKILMDKIMEDGIITRDEHDEFMEIVAADGQIDEVEKAQISRMFQGIRDGRITIVDEEREASQKLRKENLRKTLLKEKVKETQERPESGKKGTQVDGNALEKLRNAMKNLGGKG